ncbi:MAG: sugar-binding protein [Armatimonadota bacterium]
MRRRLFLLVAIALTAAVVLPALAQNTKFYTPPIVSVPKVKAAPKIDGIIEPAEWANAAPLSPFVLVGGQGQPVNATSVWVMYDDHSLYIAAVLTDPNPAGLKATTTDRDGPVWEDDSLELFFDTDDQRKSYIHIAVNPKEVQYDAYLKDRSADYRWKARCATLAGAWSVEFELPFANDFPPALGVKWGFSAARHCAADGEISAWDRKQASFHEVANFGSLVFADAPLSMEITSLGALALGKNTAQVAVRNNAEQARTCKVNVRVLGRDKYGSFFAATKATAPASARQTVSVPYTIPQDGFSTVAFALTDAAGKTVWRSSPYAATNPEIAPQISAIEKTLGTSTRAWMSLPDGEGKKALQADLDTLTAQWRYLVAQHRERAKLDKSDLQGLVDFADKLRSDAEMLQKQIEAAKASGRTDAKFGVAPASSLQHVFPNEFGYTGSQSLRLDACRNETESAQLVVLPFC